jgi:putative toxin-antitoxin system antitoxin component (TIGR02293 family)
MATKKNKKPIVYLALENQEPALLMEAARIGIEYSFFSQLLHKIPITLNEWADILHLSHRTMQRYQKQKKSFETLQSERILEISMLYTYGEDVFGGKENFETWMNSKIIALGGAKPKSLLASSYGIQMIRDVLGRIEHGVFS